MRNWQINFSLRSLLYFLGILGLGSLVGAYFVADVLISREKFWLDVSSFFVGGLGSAIFGIWAARRIRKNHKYRNSEFHYRVAIMIVVSLTFIYALCFPLVVSPDGMEYTRLAYVLFSPDFVSEWNFYRTPLFPLSLRAAFVLGGAQPESALLVTTFFGLAGTLLLGETVRRITTGTSGAITLLILAVYPVLIGYEHSLLSETGTFFFLALLLFLFTRFATSASSKGWSYAFAICLVLATGYYWRPTIIYLSPVMAVLCALTILLAPGYARGKLGLLSSFCVENRGMFFKVLTIGIFPWLLTVPWRVAMAHRNISPSDLVLPFKLYKQVVVPLSDPVLRDYAKQYQAVIDRNSQNGALPVDGVAIGDSYEFSLRIASAFNKAGVIRLIERYPLRYALAVSRSMAFFLGWPSSMRVDDENGNFARWVLGLWPPSNSLSSSIGWDLTNKKLIPRTYRGGARLGSTLSKTFVMYEWLLRLGSIAAISLFCLGVIRKSPIALAASSIPLSFLFLHALAALPANRYAFPAYPLLLANLVLIFSFFKPRKTDSVTNEAR